ncbi:chloramphenicol-sensitive protein RarD [Leifsonia sp. AK011]|uniref:EamA family transporter RarD n=1 Tax=Leifsonia sp. AK011 TaxID=2723075 RepID=UPI0015CB8972|nr:EamA family transporter RarD [Leifsonia sp. AK011]NYF09682.1 chloramphenicol-sensitive protein RarD [Leifsonia sp. AK011]
MTSAPPTPDRVTGSGLAYAVSAYLLWGILPLAFVLLISSGPVEIVAWRIVFSLVFCALLLTVTRGWGRFAALARDRRTTGALALAAVFILVNWSVFIWATVNGHVVEASLGYFTNPIVTVLLGVLVLREKLRPLQWVAVGVSAIAVLVLAIGYGSFPWIALSLAFSFGLYGLVKKHVGPKADAIGGLTMETLVLAPLALVALVVMQVTTGLTIGTISPLHTVVMLSVGVLTAIPLLLFAAAARRLPLVYLGLVQYLAPILQLIIGVWLLHEAMPPERWLGFGIVWIALAILTVDMFTRGRSSKVEAAPELT